MQSVTVVSRIALYQLSISGLCDGPSSSLSVRLSVGLPIRKVYCGKMVEWIRMPLGMVSGVGRVMGVLDGCRDLRRGRVSFGDEFGASHCNHWGLCDAALPKLLYCYADYVYQKVYLHQPSVRPSIYMFHLFLLTLRHT